MAKEKKPLPPPSFSEEEEVSDDEQPPTTTTKPVVPQTRIRDEAESESSEESSEDEDEEEPEPETRLVNNPSKMPQPSTSKPASDGESESETESESESGDSEPPKLVTPINSRPMTAAAAPKDSDAEKSNGRPLFQRIWTLEDEIAILKGMIHFQSEKGPIKPTVTGIEDFHALIQKNLSIDASKVQLLGKMKNLKRKYLAAAARAKSGQPHKFQNPHDEFVYGIGKNIWVADDENERRPSAKSGGGVRCSKRNFSFLIVAAESIGTRFAAEKLAKIDPEKAEVLENRFKKQKLAEMKHHTRKMDLLKETVKLIMEGVESATC